MLNRNALADQIPQKNLYILYIPTLFLFLTFQAAHTLKQYNGPWLFLEKLLYFRVF